MVQLATWAAALLSLAIVVQGAAGRYVVTAADPAAALKTAAALVAGVGSTAPAAQPTADALQARLAAPAAQPMSARMMDVGTELKVNSTAVMDSDTLDELVAFLASPANARALQAAAAANDTLADVLDAPPFNRTERCTDALRGNVSAEVTSCYCDGALPWPHCDALLHLWLMDALGSLQAAVTRSQQPSAAALAHPGRRLRGSGSPRISCDLLTGLFSFAATDGACANARCSVSIPTVGKVYGEVKGCAYAVSANYDPTLPGDQQTGEVCTSTGCNSITLSALADADTSGNIHDSSIGGQISLCLDLLGLTDLLAGFGWKGALCAEVAGSWRPLQGQVSAGGRMQLGWKIANLYAEFYGDVQLLDPADNKLCQLAALDSRLGCKSWCYWSPGQGTLQATVGWEVLSLGPSVTKTLFDDPVGCRSPTVPSASDTSSSTDSGGSSSGDSSGGSNSGSSSSAASSSGNSCTMPGPLYDLGLMGGTVLDGPRTVQTWEECCVACQNWGGCNGWAWIGTSDKCDGNPCCWLKDTSSSYEEELKGAVISYAGLVDD